MADPFSSAAAVLSTLDVCLKACRGLYDISHGYKEAPLELEQLRCTIRDVESVLRNLSLLTTEYQSSRAAVHYHEALPEAVKNCVLGISRTLKELADLLPPPDDSLQTKQRLRWVSHKKKLIELQQRLGLHQNTLCLCLQTIAQ